MTDSILITKPRLPNTQAGRFRPIGGSLRVNQSVGRTPILLSRGELVGLVASYSPRCTLDSLAVDAVNLLLSYLYNESHEPPMQLLAAAGITVLGIDACCISHLCAARSLSPQTYVRVDSKTATSPHMKHLCGRSSWLLTSGYPCMSRTWHDCNG